MPKKTTVPGTLENVVQGGKTVGFRFGVRLPRYRGNMLSLVNGYYVDVDGEEYPQNALALEINDKAPRTFEDIRTAVWEHWNYEDMAYLYVEKPGGLTSGKHKVIATISNYEQYGYSPSTDQYRVDNEVVPTAAGTGFGDPALPVELELKSTTKAL